MVRCLQTVSFLLAAKVHGLNLRRIWPFSPDFGESSLLRNEPQYPTKGYCMLHTAAERETATEDFFLIRLSFDLHIS